MIAETAIMAHTQSQQVAILSETGSSIFLENEQKTYFFHPGFQVNK